MRGFRWPYLALTAIGAGLLPALGSCDGGRETATYGSGGAAGAGGVGVEVCASSLDCAAEPGGRTICDSVTGDCVACVAASDCPEDNDCTAHECVPYTSCMTSLECPIGQVCDAAIQRCVECVEDADCAEGQTCAGSQCRLTCDSDNDCTPLGLLCDRDRGYCVRCFDHAECPEPEHCLEGDCAPDVCDANEQGCDGNSVVACDAEGTGFAPVLACVAPEQCMHTANGAECQAGAGGAGGGAGAGGTGGAGAAGSAGSGGVGGGSTIPSCAGMTGTECQGESCCTAPPVPEGSYLRGRETEACATCTLGCPSGFTCSADETPEHSAAIAGFALDKYEVTVGRFRRYVASYTGNLPAIDAGAHPNVAGSGWQATYNGLLPASAEALTTAVVNCTLSSQCMDAGVCDFHTWTDTPADNENRPINCVSWYEALAFCIWDGGRLPTEAEWEYAAGGSENVVFPWGNEPTLSPSQLVYSCTGDGSAGCSGYPDILSVGSKPAGGGPFGHLDLLGSVAEWQFDLVAAYSDLPCSDCVNVSSGTNRSARGGNWYLETEMRTATRAGRTPDEHRVGTGFRCARPL